MFHIIEDCEPIREMLAEIIRDDGGRALAFSSPVEYLEYLVSDQFELPCGVLTDLHLPQMSGYEMMEKAHAIEPRIRFAVISGEPNIDGDCKHHACLFLMKPFWGNSVIEVIQLFQRCQIEGANPEAIGCLQFGDSACFGERRCSCPHKDIHRDRELKLTACHHRSEQSGVHQRMA